MPYVHKNELGNMIVVTRKNHNWINESPMAAAYRRTYLNLLNELDLMLVQHDN